MVFASVYTLVGDNDEILYIGSARNVLQRVGQHAAELQWWGDVKRVDLEHFRSIGDARDAERDAIVAKRPKYNVLHNRGPRRGDAEVVQLRGDSPAKDAA